MLLDNEGKEKFEEQPPIIQHCFELGDTSIVRGAIGNTNTEVATQVEKSLTH